MDFDCTYLNILLSAPATVSGLTVAKIRHLYTEIFGCSCCYWIYMVLIFYEDDFVIITLIDVPYNIAFLF